MTDRRLIPFALLLAVLVAACSSTPSGVIAPEAMARLMADIRMADAVVSVNAREYRTDSSRQVLRQAVFERNGVTAAEFDTSLVWYGHNLKQYQEVTDRTIEILEERLAAAGSAGGVAVSVAGDSVDVWTAPVAYSVSGRSPSQYITFSLDSDPNWERGDVYIWRFKQVVPGNDGAWAITTEYDDGAIEVQNGQIISSNSRPEITFYTDSTRTARNINGWIHLTPAGHKPVEIDSVSLVRRRMSPGSHMRNYRQVLYTFTENGKARTDTTAAAR